MHTPKVGSHRGKSGAVGSLVWLPWGGEGSPLQRGALSSNGQAVDGFGLDVQEKAIRTWARANGHQLLSIERDEGISGATDALDRPGLSAALLSISEREADGIIVARLDRLARALTVQEAALA